MGNEGGHRLASDEGGALLSALGVVCDSTPVRSIFNAALTPLQRGSADAEKSLTKLGKSRTDLFGGEKINPPEKGQLFSLLGARVTFALQSLETQPFL